MPLVNHLNPHRLWGKLVCDSKTQKMLGLATKKLLGVALAEAPIRPLQVLPRLYHERVVDHYNHPRNVGSFEKNEPGVGTGLVGAPACGDVMKLQIKVDEKTGKIVDACFKTFGCGSAIASSSVGSYPTNFACSDLILILLCLQFWQVFAFVAWKSKLR